MSWENKPFMINNTHRLATVEEVEAVVGRPASMIMLKELGALDEGCLRVLEHSPVAGFGFRDADGVSRTTFVGGRAGFARVRSARRISFRLGEPGSAAGPASLVFLLPGVGETLRVNGSATGSGEVVFDVEQVYVHCAQAVLRSGLWQGPALATPGTGGSRAVLGDNGSTATPGDGGSTAVRSEDGSPGAPEVTDGPLAAPGVAGFLATAPFLALSTWDSQGGGDTSPRGESGPVARVLDGRTLVIADRKGNKRADTLHNLLADDRVSFAALVPGRNGVLHVRGRATITVDPVVLEPLSLRGVPPPHC
ncbi:pyridoxamine 5'-phosphate oxidase family protein [Lentzea guizhouensis]|uniref:pyridoxamine 5'-phosphate oxidase family protein n=1 Tax=Lentzea guizhouensis TaxID=1586287 RepID=UPI000A4B3900|nr:pyridoxamine 5'-phosphate oxidase family protein [Lentzea guizhouensis]